MRNRISALGEKRTLRSGWKPDGLVPSERLFYVQRMTVAARVMLAIWLIVGVPFLAILSLWGRSLWLPFPLLNESASYYVVWVIASALICGSPIAIIVTVVRMKRNHRH